MVSGIPVRPPPRNKQYQNSTEVEAYEDWLMDIAALGWWWRTGDAKHAWERAKEFVDGRPKG